MGNLGVSRTHKAIQCSMLWMLALCKCVRVVKWHDHSRRRRLSSDLGGGIWSWGKRESMPLGLAFLARLFCDSYAEVRGNRKDHHRITCYKCQT